MFRKLEELKALIKKFKTAYKVVEELENFLKNFKEVEKPKMFVVSQAGLSKSEPPCEGAKLETIGHGHKEWMVEGDFFEIIGNRPCKVKYEGFFSKYSIHFLDQIICRR